MLVVMPELAFALDVLAVHVGSRTAPHCVEASSDSLHGVLGELFILPELSSSDETRPCWSLCLLSKGLRSSFSLFGGCSVSLGASHGQTHASLCSVCYSLDSCNSVQLVQIHNDGVACVVGF